MFVTLAALVAVGASAKAAGRPPSGGRETAPAGRAAWEATAAPAGSGQGAAPAETPAPTGGEAAPGTGTTPPGAATTPPGASAAPATPLSLEEALKLGLAQDLPAVLAAVGVEEAEAARREALSRLLPQVEATASESRQIINLAAFGLAPPNGESPLVGPFNTVDARIHVAGALLDASALARLAAAREQLAAARLTYQEARELVIGAVAELYLEALADRARIDTASSQVDVAAATAELASDRHRAGKAAGIDELRARVRLAEERQRLLEAQNAYAKRQLALARALGLAPDVTLALGDEIPFVPLAERDPAAALTQARERRADLGAARARLRGAEDALAAAGRERLPSLGARGDYGTIGPDLGSAETTFAIAAEVRVPLFAGGRIAGDVAVAQARRDAAKARLADLDRQVELEVRSALLDVDSAARQLAVATDGQQLATQQLAQARDRFAAGVTSNLEVIQAQEALADANERRLRSLSDHNRAKVRLALALGLAEESAAHFLRGTER